jgi:hypothetical protein
VLCFLKVNTYGKYIIIFYLDHHEGLSHHNWKDEILECPKGGRQVGKEVAHILRADHRFAPFDVPGLLIVTL